MSSIVYIGIGIGVGIGLGVGIGVGIWLGSWLGFIINHSGVYSLFKFYKKNC